MQSKVRPDLICNYPKANGKLKYIGLSDLKVLTQIRKRI